MLKERRFFLVLICTLLVFAVGLSAQDTVNVPKGTIAVRRPPVQAFYSVNVQYFYPPKARRQKLTKVSSSEIVFSDSANDILPPVPYNFRSGEWSKGALSEYLRDNYPVDSFAWQSFFSSMDYAFAWSDTARSDSARFQFRVTRKGEVLMQPIPWKNADSTCRRFEEISSKKMHSCMYWYPARRFKDERKRKLRTVDSVILVTVYAYDPSRTRFMPIESKVK